MQSQSHSSRVCETLLLFFTKAKFELVEVGGNHLFPLDKDCKKVWQMWIVDRLVDFSVTKQFAIDPAAKDMNAIIT